MSNSNSNSVSVIQHVVALVDRSGSMAGKEDDTIGGINTTFDELKNDPTPDIDVKVSIKLFDHEEKMLIKEMDLDKVKPITRDQYYPRGQTALYDAIGNTLEHFIQKKIDNNNAYKLCSVYVVTDGYENSSKDYNQKTIKQMIENAEKYYDIKLFYLAANQDAILSASAIGINQNQALDYCETSDNVQSAFRSMGASAKRHASGTHVGFTQFERSASYAPSSPRPSLQNSSPPRLRRQPKLARR